MVRVASRKLAKVQRDSGFPDKSMEELFTKLGVKIPDFFSRNRECRIVDANADERLSRALTSMTR